MEIFQKCMTCKKPCLYRNWTGVELKEVSNDSASFFEAQIASQNTNQPKPPHLLILPPGFHHPDLENLDYSH